MAAFFLMFAFFKLINLEQFAEAYSMYDIIAKRAYWYGYLYPFIELGLGVAYLLNWRPKVVNIFTLCMMLICATGVFIELRLGKKIVCACLGAVFKLPMTYVTLLEDLLMAAMAGLMLLI
jgi:phage shock protein PspC (stress-responsive transcriptional regulator)